MSARDLVVSTLALVACSHRQSTSGGTFAPPGGPIFSLVVVTATGSPPGGPELGPDYTIGWSPGRSTHRIEKTWVIATDPLTGVRKQLGWVGHVGSGSLVPFHWDAAGKILWVSAAPRSRIVGLVEGGVVFPGNDQTLLVTTHVHPTPADLPAPFGYWRDGIWNAVTGDFVSVVVPDRARWFHAGNLLRAIAMPISEFDITVTTIDWARRSVEVQGWQLPAPDSSDGTRRAIEITADGRHVLEVLESKHQPGSGSSRIGPAAVHDAAVSAFTIPRFRCSRCRGFGVHDRVNLATHVIEPNSRGTTMEARQHIDLVDVADDHSKPAPLSQLHRSVASFVRRSVDPDLQTRQQLGVWRERRVLPNESFDDLRNRLARCYSVGFERRCDGSDR